jgi:hypothetical protein
VAAGHTHVRLLTTPILAEARSLYAAGGYAEIERMRHAGGPEEIWMEKALGGAGA